MTSPPPDENQQAQAFALNVLGAFFSDMHRLETDNYDKGRFSADGADRSMQFDPARHAFCLHSFVSYQLAFFRAGRLLADAESQNLYTALIRFQLAGHLHVRLPTNAPDYWGQNDFLEAKNFSPSPWAKEFPETKIHHCELIFRGKKLVYDGSFVKSAWVHKARQYFFERGGARIQPEKGDHVVDAGTCMGETCIAFGEAIGPEGWVYGFDVLDSHLRLCQANIDQNPGLANFKLFGQGLSDKVFEPAAKQTEPKAVLPGFSLLGQDEVFPTTTLDYLVEKGEIARVDFLKMDIEGSEILALKGAERTIRRFKPKLAISIYHVFTHYFEAILFLHSLNLGYRFYIEHYTIHSEETVLYAVAEK